MLDIDQIPVLYADWRARYAERDTRMSTIDEAVRGDMSVYDPDDEKLESRSPNLIQVALEDTAESASLMPTVRVTPSSAKEAAKKASSKMERIGVGYLGASSMDVALTETLYDLAGFGIGCWVIWPDEEQGIPFFEKRDPRTCYPEPGLRLYDPPRRVLFARQVYHSQLPVEWQNLMQNYLTNDLRRTDGNVPVTIVEYFDEHEGIVAGLFESRTHPSGRPGGVAYTPVELDRWENPTGMCQAVIGSRFSLDGEYRGQFDQVIGAMAAHIRLMGMVLDYADQSVYSDIWVKDLIGEMPYGGGAYIELGPNGAIGRVPPAVTSFSVQQDLAQLVDAIHLGARWPKSRPGEVDQAIASAKFVEATAGVMNTAIKTYHQILRSMLERALRVAYKTDVLFFPGTKITSGILRNQEFLEEYNPATDIDLDAKVRVEYGLGFGRDPAQSAVLHIQYGQNEYISKETVQENIPGIIDVARENARIETERLRGMLFAKILTGVESGEIPDEALIEVMEARAANGDLADIYRKHVLEPRKEMEANQVGTGLGDPLMAGMGPEQMPGAPSGPAAPPAPNPADLLARINIPAGPGGTLGAQQA